MKHLYRLPGLLFTIVMLLICWSNNALWAQELEPRSLTNVPVGMSFAAAGYGYAEGNILLDPAVPIEDLNGRAHTFIGAYVRAINVFGLSGKIDVIAPYATGNWTGKLDGVDSATSRSGMGDLRFRFAFNYLGAPALKKSEFVGYKPQNISGFSIQIIAPTGQYFPEKLINLGSNRWVFRPQWGFSRYINKWILETYVSAWFFTKNSDFYVGRELKQQNLYALKFHAIRSFKKGMWMAINTGYALGGKSVIDGQEMDTRISTIRFGIVYAVPLGLQHSLKFTAISAIRFEKGSDFGALAVFYQYRWGGK
jgi:hypothetical protein